MFLLPACGGKEDPAPVVPQKVQTVALKFMDGQQVPFIVLDSLVGNDAIAAGYRFHYLVSTDGFEAMGDPTVADPEMPDKGIVVPVTKASDILYVKTAGFGPQGQSVYLRTIVRNARMDINFWRPVSGSEKYNGMNLELPLYYSGSSISDGRVGYCGVNKGTLTVNTNLKESVSLFACFFGGSFASTFSIYLGTTNAYSLEMKAKEYFFDSRITKVISSGPDVAGPLKFSWSSKIWLVDMATLESEEYMPEASCVGSAAEDYNDNTIVI